jgi:CcmD family protein
MRSQRAARAGLAGALLLLALTVSPVVTLAQDQPAAEPPAAAAPAGDKATAAPAGDKAGGKTGYGEGFQAVGANEKETVPGGTLLVVAYALAWLAIFGYLALIWRRQAQVQLDLDDLSRRVDAHKKR